MKSDFSFKKSTGNYEYQAKLAAAKGTIGYGLLWIFVSFLISGLPLLGAGAGNIIGDFISIISIILGLARIIKGGKMWRRLYH